MAKKVIVLADCHIDDFNIGGPGQFLREYSKVAEIVRDKAIEVEAPFIILAGDTLNKPISPPHVVAELYDFLRILSESKAKIVWISGQHDQNVKELESIKDTYLSVFKNIFYGHGQSITIDGCKLYFENYTRENYVDPLQESDVYVSHVTLGSQQVNNKKFKLGVFGDIHEEMDIENMHSVTPVRPFRAHENPHGVIGIITCDHENPTFERFIYDPDYKIFPKLEKVERTIKKETLTDEDREALEILSCNHDFYKDIDEVVEKMGLSEIHRLVNMSSAPEPISLDFRIKKFYARDFRSIKDVCIELDKLGRVIFVSGSNGSGKSSLIDALFVGLLSDRHIDRFQNNDEGSEIMVGNVLEYKGHEYEICRGKGWTKFIIDGKEVTKANKTRLDEYIYECLPFLKLLWFFYIKTYEHFFDKDRIEMVKQCFNLNIFDHFYNQGKLILSNARQDLGKSLDETNQLKGKYDQEKVNLANFTRDLESYSNIDINEESSISESLSVLRNTLTKRATKKSQVNILRSHIQELEEKINGLKTKDKETTMKQLKACKEQSTLSIEIRSTRRSIESIDAMLNNLKMVTCPNCGSTFQFGGTAKEDLLKQKESLNDLLQGYSKQFKEASDICGANTEKMLEDMLSQIERVEVYKGQLDKYNNEIEQAYSELRDLDFDLSLMPQEKDLQDKLVAIGKKKIIVQNRIRSEQNVQIILEKAREVKQRRLQIQTKIEQAEKYVALFDMKNLDSLPYRLLVKVSEYLSTDTIQFKTYSEMANGNMKLDISCKMKVGDHRFIDYDDCSHGQKTILDIYILSRILELLGNVGIVTIDEGLSVLQADKYNQVCEIIRQLDAKNIFITSHDANFVDYDSIIHCSLLSSGDSEIEVS